MKAIKSPDTALIAATVMAGAVAAVASFATLSALSTPPHLKARVEAVETSVNRSRAMFARPRESPHYLAQPICRASPASAPDLVRAELSGAASQSGVMAPSITLEPSGQDLTSQTYPVMFTLEVTDRYDLVLGFLHRLAQSEPEVFADSLDLTTKTSAVALKLTGRVVCLTRS